MAKRKFKNKVSRKRFYTVLAISAYALFASACGKPASTQSASAPSTQAGQQAGVTGTVCRVPDNLVATLTGTYQGTLTTSLGAQTFTLAISEITIPGFSGKFLSGTFNTSGSMGTETFSANFCTEAVMNPAKTLALGAYLQSVPTTVDSPMFDYINRGVPFRTFFQLGLSSGTQFDPSQSWIGFQDCGLFDQSCSSPTNVVGVSVTALTKI